MIAQKYKPTTQKALFHKDIVNHIRKWIKNVEDYADDSKPVQQILFLYGPMGCSKTVTVECLFKGYNLYEIDTDTIKSNDKLVETIQGLVNFRDKTLANIDKWNQKSRKDKSNMILVDNLELCDKGIENFIDVVYTKHNINIPMVFVCNSIRYKDIFVNYKNCTFLEFKKPSLLELTKLSIDIVKEEDLDLSKQQIKILIEKSEYDIRQLLFLLEQWYYSKRMKHEFDMFIENIQIKNIDKDLNEKMEDVFNYKQRFNFSELFTLGSSEPVTLSNSIYQNYTNSIYQNYTNSIDKNLDKQDSLCVLENYCKIMDNISISNLIYNEIYENQNWDLYNNYISHSVVIPGYYLKQNNRFLFEKRFGKQNIQNIQNIQNTNNQDLMDVDEQVTDIDQSIKEWDKQLFNFTPFKDVSYNFTNSYDEVKRISNNNIYCKILNYKGFKSRILQDPVCCFFIVDILINSIEKLNEYFDKNKKGKNTTKKEKLELCENIERSNFKMSLDILVNIVYEYKLFEINVDDFLINRKKYIDEEILKQNIQKIDLKVFKRLLNIFTMNDKHKCFKSHIETSIQYKILGFLVKNYIDEPSKISYDINNILTEDLNKIWNLG
jgi:hypothetical protein